MRASRSLSLTGGLVRMGFLRLLAYRLRYFTGVVTYTLNVSVYYFIWRAIHSEVERRLAEEEAERPREEQAPS